MSNSSVYALIAPFIRPISHNSIKLASSKVEELRRNTHHWFSKVLIIGIGMLCLAGLPVLAKAIDAHKAIIDNQPENVLAELESRVAEIWGADNVWLPNPKVWVQYEADLGERSAVDFENGVATVQILIKATDDPQRELVLEHLRQGVGNLILAEAKDPLKMIKSQGTATQTTGQNDVVATLSKVVKEVRVYLVRQGDSLWKIAQRFRMKTEALAKLNGIAIDTILSVGRPLKVMVFSSHDLTLDSGPIPVAKDPLLKDQLLMVDGRPVSQWLVRDFAEEVVRGQRLSTKTVLGADGIERLAVGVEFKLVANHLEVRARKFHPLVLSHAEKHELDPALIMAIIHTESMFNPRARSRTPAYGLMQVVPHSGGRDAYRKIYGKKQKLTSKYLYNPKNNIELGVAYFDILKNKYMKAILDPTSRTYCAVAAYNAGASNVGRAFIPKKSIRKATPVINRMEPQEVYARLVDNLPSKESRNYVRKVLKRTSLYQEW
jgi:LysM repeat protein